MILHTSCVLYCMCFYVCFGSAVIGGSVTVSPAVKYVLIVTCCYFPISLLFLCSYLFVLSRIKQTEQVIIKLFDTIFFILGEILG